ncbi:hypothetical protein MIND_00241100 [Mycena indigotica]|uniref:Uncharacterized protein n=1 Tax=Mycena indigotica TaxID=2126181 RepID=A0A8H6T8Q5_9AGAR|nr:uncharacterized protein MIND_00241100 [Mycena indigotica]KAF7312281.1 hypothetical protein MIND_00241100 [Mycena indigotica]
MFGLTGYLLQIFMVTILLAPTAAQLRVGNLTHVLPQCNNVCNAYNVMNTQCNAVGVYEITFIYCECTPTNLQIVLDCFNCQSVNTTQQQLMQELLDDIVHTCNDRTGAPDSTVTVSSLAIVPSSSSLPTPNAGTRGHEPTQLSGAVLALGLLLLFGLS